MGEKHHLMRHEDKAETRLRGHTLWTPDCYDQSKWEDGGGEMDG